MKKLLVLLIASAFIMPVMAADDAKAETKKVCVKQKDAKTGKEKDVCKNVKIHKKHEGTAVPEKAGKK
jgi:Ni/Co efflux regulator RcnB